MQYVITALEISIDIYEFCQKHYPTVRDLTVKAAIAFWNAFLYMAECAYESGAIVGEGYFSFEPVGLLMPAQEEVPETGLDMVAVMAGIEPQLEGQSTDIACHLGDWWIGQSGRTLKSTMHLRKAYQRAMSAEAAIQGL